MNNELVKGKSEYESLREHIAALRDEIALLTAERDELKFRECPRIQAEYDAKIGYRVLELYRAKARLLQLKRAVEILQAARNRQEKKDAEEAKQEAKEAYREYEKKLEEDAKKINETKEYRRREEKKDAEWQERYGRTGGKGTGGKKAGTRGMPAEPGRDMISLNAEETGEDAEGAGHGTRKQDDKGADSGRDRSGQNDGTSEGASGGKSSGPDKQEPPEFKSREDALKYYHRKLVKMLHPDANPNQTKEEADLFLEAEKAFQEGDLDKLIEIYDFLIAKNAEMHLSDTPEDIERLREIAQTLEKKKNALLDEIEEIKTSFPYTAKDLLENEEEVAEILHRIEEGMKEIDRQYQELLIRFNRLKEGKDPNGTD